MIRQPGTGPSRSKTKHAFETFCSKPASLGDLETALDCAHRCRLRSDSPYPDDAAGSRIRTSDAIASALMTLEEIERAHILNTPNRNGGNRSGSATDLGISARKFTTGSQNTSAGAICPDRQGSSVDRREPGIAVAAFVDVSLNSIPEP